jgi:isocitrate lyase
MQPEIRIQAQTKDLEARWQQDARWAGIERTYTAADVVRLRGSVVPESTLARLGAERLWQLLHEDEPVRALGAMTGGQAVQMVRAGLKAVYLSGWQVATRTSPATRTPTRASTRRTARPSSSSG